MSRSSILSMKYLSARFIWNLQLLVSLSDLGYRCLLTLLHYILSLCHWWLIWHGCLRSMCLHRSCRKRLASHVQGWLSFRNTEAASSLVLEVVLSFQQWAQILCFSCVCRIWSCSCILQIQSWFHWGGMLCQLLIFLSNSCCFVSVREFYWSFHCQFQGSHELAYSQCNSCTWSMSLHTFLLYRHA